jgi:hypothetical protein
LINLIQIPLTFECPHLPPAYDRDHTLLPLHIHIHTHTHIYNQVSELVPITQSFRRTSLPPLVIVVITPWCLSTDKVQKTKSKLPKPGVDAIFVLVVKVGVGRLAFVGFPELCLGAKSAGQMPATATTLHTCEEKLISSVVLATPFPL